jgi:uncharacterized protein
MTAAQPVAQAGSFVAGNVGSRFRLVSEPSDRHPRGTIIFVHGFAEEMNKSRRMVARMARRLAADGWRVVQRDLCGCGDSSGEFVDASWQAWIDDVDAELSLADAKHPVWLWCLRAGALLVPAVLANRRQVNLLLWQPVLSGAQHLQQFLRLHAGARIAGSGKDSGKASPAQALRSGASVEVGGYQLGPALAAGIEQASFDLPEHFEGRVVWFEVSADDAAALSPPTLRAVERLKVKGLSVTPRALRGPPFWQTQEIEECETLLEQTLAELRASPPPDAATTTRAPALEPAEAPGVRNG